MVKVVRAVSRSLADPIVAGAVAASNALTVKWARTHIENRSTVMAGVGVWPLLALLAASAEGDARRELETASGLQAAEGIAWPGSLIATFKDVPGISAALGIWIHRSVPVLESWLVDLPPGTFGALAGDGLDQDRLNKWAATNTDGKILQLPITVRAETLLVLASTLLVQTRWLQPFDVDDLSAFSPGYEPWGRLRNFTTLSRTGPDLNDLAIANSPSIGPLTVSEVRGQHGISVFLAIAGQAATPGQVIAEAISVSIGQRQVRHGSALAEGDTAPGLSIAAVQTSVPSPTTLRVVTVPFRIEAQHDLLGNATIFGLQTATDRSRGHFPHISRLPLTVDQGNQTVLAAFSAEGFEAAAVTAIGVTLGASLFPPPQHRHLEIEVSFSRPFAFVAVHKPTRLVLVAGWVAEPQPINNPEVFAQWGFPDLGGSSK